jgi:hypothetical protein
MSIHSMMIMIFDLCFIILLSNYGFFHICRYKCVFSHLIVTYARYLETFKCQNVVYTLHGVLKTLHQLRLKNQEYEIP